MSLQIDSNLPNNENFIPIYNLLMQNPNKIDIFFKKPEKFLIENGINADSNILEILKRISKLNIDTHRMNFNEKLVLCSASGY